VDKRQEEEILHEENGLLCNLGVGCRVQDTKVREGEADRERSRSGPRGAERRRKPERVTTGSGAEQGNQKKGNGQQGKGSN